MARYHHTDTVQYDGAIRKIIITYRVSYPYMHVTL